MDPQQLLVANLGEALKQLQRHLVLALVASLSLMLLQFSSNPQAGEQTIHLPGLVTGVDIRMAKLILGTAHVFLAFLAIASAETAKNIASRIKDQALRAAALSYPSVATDADPGIRRPACLAPPLFFVIGLAVWAYRHPHGEWGFIFAAFLFGVLPYVLLMNRVENLGKFPEKTEADGSSDKAA